MRRRGPEADDTRALRDALEAAQAELRRTREHLEKLRAHHAKEREALEAALEVARRDAVAQRARAEQAESREAELRQTREFGSLAARTSAAPTPAAPSVGAAKVLVALPRPPGVTEEVVRALADVLRLSPADVRLRLAQPPPVLLARLTATDARTLGEALRAAGFAPVTWEVTPRSAGGLPQVRRFTLDVGGLRLETSAGGHLEARYEDVRLLVRGQRTTVEVETRDEVDYDEEGNRSSGRVEVKREHVEHFLWVYGEGFRAAFTSATDFGGLGEKRGLTKFAGLQGLVEELRWRAPHAVLDDRLLRMPRLVLPFVDADRGQETFAELLFQSVRAGLWP